MQKSLKTRFFGNMGKAIATITSAVCYIDV